MAQDDRERRALHRLLRTLCEDLDELLGRVGDAVRRGTALEAAGLLGRATVIATELAEGLSPGALWHRRAMPHVLESVLDEVDVQRTLLLLEELDAELDHCARGRGAGRAAALAGRLVGEIGDLIRAAASGRVRPRTGPHRLVRSSELMSRGAATRSPWTTPCRPTALEKR